MKQATRFTKLALLLVVAGALALAGCGGDDGVSQSVLDQTQQELEEERQAREAEAARLGRIAAARTAIAAAATAADAQAAYDAVKDEATAAESAELMQAVTDRTAAIATAEENQRLEMERQAEMARMGRIADAMTAIAAAATPEAAQMAYDAVKDEATATEAAALMQAVTDRTAALAMMDRATQQMMALAAAAANVDVTAFDLTTATGIAAAEAAIAALQSALDAAVDVSDADKAMYQSQLNAASLPVMTARAEADRMGRIAAARMAIMAAATPEDAIMAFDMVTGEATLTEAEALHEVLQTRLAELATMARAATQMMALSTASGNIDLSDLSTQEAVNAASTAIAALEVALAAAVDVSDAEKSTYQATVTAGKMAVMTAQGVLDHAAQTMALSNAVMDLNAIDLGDLSDQAKIDAAQAAIDDLQAALDAATELSDAEKAAALAELATATRTVTMAQGRVDVAGQMAALTTAINALEAIDLDNLMTQAQIDAAEKAIVALDLALADATDLTAAQKLDATVDVTLAKRKVADAKVALANNIGDQKMMLTDAGNALGALDLTDLSDQAKIDAAQDAIDDLQMALDNATHVSDADKAMYQRQLDDATEDVRMAQTGMDASGRMAAQRTELTDAMAAARTAVGGVDDDSTDSEVASADAAITRLENAITNAVDLPAGDTDVATAQGTLTTLKGLLASAKTSRMLAMDDQAEEDMKAAAALGKAMRAALAGPTAGGNALANIAQPTLTATGTMPLTIDAANGAGALTTDPGSVELTTGDSAGSLGGWAGTDYARSTGTGTAMVTNEARVYVNKGPGRSQAFSGTGGKYTLIAAGLAQAGYLLLGEAATPVTRASAAAFTHSGTQTYQVPAESDAFYVSGTYDGAPGRFRCAAGCSSTNDGEGNVSALGGTWHFKPDAGAMVMEADAHYLYYGWWVSKDNDGDPTAASAFTGRVGTDPGDSTDGLDTAVGGETLTGSATYAGHAVGKFAISNPLDSTGNGGHFTADAELMATFGTAATAGMTGTIDNFRLNDGSDDPGWSVSLHRAGWGTGTSGEIQAPTDDVATTTVDEAMGTTWSIGDNSGGRSGTWSGQMYDEKPGDPSATGPGDGSNIPTTVTGTFYSEFSTIGRMVGAFGAEKQ